MNFDNGTIIDAKLTNARRDIIKKIRLKIDIYRTRNDKNRYQEKTSIAVGRNSKDIEYMKGEECTALYIPESNTENALHPEPTEQKRKFWTCSTR